MGSSQNRDVYQWRRSFHVPVLIFVQIVFIVLFGVFVIYDPNSAVGHSADAKDNAQDQIKIYPSEFVLSIKSIFLLVST